MRGMFLRSPHLPKNIAYFISGSAIRGPLTIYAGEQPQKIATPDGWWKAFQAGEAHIVHSVDSWPNDLEASANG